MKVSSLFTYFFGEEFFCRNIRFKKLYLYEYRLKRIISVYKSSLLDLMNVNFGYLDFRKTWIQLWQTNIIYLNFNYIINRFEKLINLKKI